MKPFCCHKVLQKVGTDPRRDLETDLAAECDRIACVLLMDEARLVIAACLHSMPKTQVKKGKKEHIQKEKCEFSC